MPASVEESAGKGMARAPGERLGSAFRASHAAEQAEDLREVMRDCFRSLLVASFFFWGGGGGGRENAGCQLREQVK